MAKYKEIAKKIKDQIQENEYNIDLPLPSQETLAKEFNTSRVTIHKALQFLVMEGVVFSRQGSGTYIRKNTFNEPSLDLDFNEHIGLTQRASKKGEISNKIISFSVRFPTQEECEKLLINKNDPVYDIIRLRLLNNEPFLMEYTIIPVQVIPNITENILSSSVYSYIKNDLKLKIGGANRRISADRPRDLEIQYLECDATDPMLEVEQVTYLSSGIPFEYIHSRHRYDKRSILVHSLYNDK